MHSVVAVRHKTLERALSVDAKTLTRRKCSLGSFQKQFALARATGSPPSAPSRPRRKRLAVFISGGGSNFKAIQHAIDLGQINGSIVVAVSDKPTCKGVQLAQAMGIPTILYPQPKNLIENHYAPGDEELIELLVQSHGVDFVLLAGYLKLIPAALVRAFPRAMLNIHPGLLPAFGGKGMYGKRVHQAVIDSGARFSGPTIHFVDEEYDSGPILAQACVPVHPLDTADTLAARVLHQEHSLYPQAVAALCDDRITWRDDGIPIIWHAH